MKELYHDAVALLRKVSTGAGFTATPAVQDNYYRVWTRDATVCGIACTTLNDAALSNSFKQSLQTTWQHQHPTGCLPSNVAVQSGEAGYGGSTGRADNTSWGIIGACLYASATGDHVFLQELEPKMEKAFQVLDAWEYNGRNLIYVPQSGDWADEYMQHGYILFDQLLRYWALALAAKMLGRKDYAEKATLVKQAIENNFFYREIDEHWYSAQLKRMKAGAPKDFWWLGFNPSQLYPQFDLQANMLCLLLRIGTPEQQKKLTAWLQEYLRSNNHMLPSFYPAINSDNRLMAELESNYAYRFRNKPFEFHNGGLWPVWNGWMCAALLPYNETLYNSILERMETDMAAAGSPFNECLHGITGEPCGVNDCAWSAAGYIIAKNAVLFNQITAL